MGRKYRGKTIAEETIAFGIGGKLRHTEEMPAFPPEGLVTFQATAKIDSEKFKFVDGAVQQITTLVIDTDTFSVIEVEDPPPQPEQTELPTAKEPATV